MLYADNIYFLTNKFYTIPTYKDYLQAKSGCLTSIDLNYQKKKPQEKWALLMAEFQKTLQENDMPNISLKEFKSRLSEFKSKRDGTSASLFNLSLTQCVNYFEEFYFLYTNTDPRYKLKPAEKKVLLQSIKEAIGTCETGINGRFYTALQDHRKDSDWIQNEMSKTRCGVLSLLQAKYGSTDVHVYNKLVALANKKKLGIVTKEEILDVHEGMFDTRALTTFFEREYPNSFEQYEKQAIDNLTNHYLSELASVLELNSVDWAKGPLTFPSDKATILQKSIDGHFSGANLTDIVDLMGEMSEDYTQFTFKSKKEVASIIKRLVTEKLIADQYYINLNELKENRVIHRNLRIRKGVLLDRLISVHETLQQKDSQKISDVLSKNSQILLNYPELVLSQIKSNPSILFKIPHGLKTDTRFLDATMAILDEMLCQAIAEEDNEKIDNVIAQTLDLIEFESGYLQNFSRSVLQNERVAKKLFERNVLFFGYIDDSLQSNPELLAQVEQANPFSEVSVSDSSKKWLDSVMVAHVTMHRALPSEYSQEASLACSTKPISYHRALTNFLRIKGFTTLVSSQPITSSNFLKAIDKINPDLLLKAIEYRKKHHFPPLPFFDNDKAVNDLKKFSQDLNNQLSPDWNQDYLSIRRRACEQENFASIHNPFRLKNSATYLSKTKDWFIAFKQYQAYQTSTEKLLAKLIEIARACYELFISLCKTCFFSLAIVYVYPILSTILAPYFWYGFLGSLALGAFNHYFIGNRLLATASDIIWRIIFLDVEFLFTVGFQLLAVGVKSGYQLFNVLSSTFSLFTTLFDVTLSCFRKNEYLATTLEDKCENVLVRLNSIDEISAQEKKDVLQALLLQIKTNVDEGKQTFKDGLKHKFTVVHNDQEHHVSFLEVASTRRAHQGRFNLGKQPGYMCFFRAKTTTKVLIGVESSETLGLAK